MTHDNGMDASPSWRELKAERDDHEQARTALEEEVHQVRAERDAAVEQVAYWRERAVSAEEREQALAAHVERYRAAYVKLTNRAEFADNGEGCYVADGELMHEFDSIADETPTTSLARRDLLMKSEGIEEYLSYVRKVSPDEMMDLQDYSDWLRRQAEGEE